MKYLTIITTVLVATQVVRIIQNTINLWVQNKKVEDTVKWVKDKDISERDFDTQREVFYLLKDYLEAKKYD